MGLKFWWLGLAVLLVMAGIACWRWILAGRASTNLKGSPVAHTDRLKSLPRYRQLAAHQLKWLLIEVVSLAVACLGIVVVVSRPEWVSRDSEEMRSRDVMLCLDVSESMRDTDAAVVSSFQDLVGRLQGERIGFTVFNSASATYFPLTDDYAFISEQLQQVIEELGANGSGSPVLTSTLVGNRGYSLIGDGLMSCLQGFDRPEDDRSRTVVFATDNVLSGVPLFDLSEAVDQAVDSRVLVYGIAPEWIDAGGRNDMETEVARTGGQVLALTPGDSLAAATIARGIEKTQRKAMLRAPLARSFDQPWPGALLALLGLAGVVIAGRRQTI